VRSEAIASSSNSTLEGQQSDLPTRQRQGVSLPKFSRVFPTFSQVFQGSSRLFYRSYDDSSLVF
jgi:hypothetical protein